ncbi:MAG: SM-20-related protein [Flavobacteriales bacterium]|jgi:SM-20-related protein
MKIKGNQWIAQSLDDRETVPEFVDDLANRGYAILDDFISPAEVLQLKLELLRRLDLGEFKRAGIGTHNDYKIDASVRGDQICWLNEENPAAAVLPFTEAIHTLIKLLNRYCYLGLSDFESHFAVYPPETFYERHLDQFQSNSNRAISLVLYLNEDWKEEDGGHLKLFVSEEEEREVDPLAGRLVIFKSAELEHQVCKTHATRYSITGWLLHTPKDLSFLL